MVEAEKPTKDLITDSLLELLHQKDYHDITIGQIAANAHIGRRTFYRYFRTKDDIVTCISSQLMDRFAETILKNHATDLKEISKSYFEFWENHIDVLLLLKEAHLLYFIEDNLPALIEQVAVKIEHASKEELATLSPEQMELYQYMFYFRLAGFWKLTIVWCSENPRKTPQAMSELMQKIVYAEI